jgi:small subunit ribosomal protein S6
MNYYETLYIVHSALEAGRLKDIVLTVEGFLKENGGEVVATEVWGKKKLGYFIDKQKYGTYILLQFKSDGTKNNNFNIEMEHNPSILAYMTVRIEEDGVREQTEDLDTQIAGKEAKTSRSRPVAEKPKEASTKETTSQVEETPAEEVVVEEAPVEIEGNKEEPVSEKSAPEEMVAEEIPVKEVVIDKAPVEIEENKKEIIAEDDAPAETEVTEEKVEE